MPGRPLRNALAAGARLVCAVAALAVAVPLLSAPAAQAQATTYVVRPGDTLYGIARSTGVSVDELRRLNSIQGDALTAGQTLRLSSRAPASTTLPPPTGAGGRGTHTVQPGETLYSIAVRYETTVDELRRLNGIVGTYIASGQRLSVPGGGAVANVPPNTPPTTNTPPPTNTTRPTTDRPPVTATVTSNATPTTPPLRLGPWRIDNTTVPADLVHFVEPGETLYSIATRFGFSVDQLTALNTLTTAPLDPGTLLVMPGPVDPSVPHEIVLPDADSTGLALVYDAGFAGQPTASGETYDPAALTAAHRTLPLGSVVLVTNTVSGRTVFVRVNDRGPISSAYLMELSTAAAAALELDPNAARRIELRRVP